MLAADWQNPGQPLDINDDSSVSPLDALVGINRLNDVGASALDPRAVDSTEPFYDSNRDGSHSPLDVLLVINALNDRDILLAARLNNDTAPNDTTNKDRLTNDATTMVSVALGVCPGNAVA
jgi:Dockerin type I domain